MSPAPEGSPDGDQLFRIGEAAERAGVSSRTLRWYEEIGLLAPSGHSTGGARRYSPDDLTRIEHIRELQSLLGLDLGAIRDILVGEDALAGLRREYQKGVEATRRREILVEASAINQKLRTVVTDRQELLATMMDSLEEKSARYAMLLAELDGAPTGAPGSGAPSGRGRSSKNGEARGPATGRKVPTTGRKAPASGRGRTTASR
jgi:DNA-binding transcriptional MerR regulator